MCELLHHLRASNTAWEVNALIKLSPPEAPVHLALYPPAPPQLSLAWLCTGNAVSRIHNNCWGSSTGVAAGAILPTRDLSPSLDPSC